jgi:L-ascorbate metabolism protein UlaG (beta-lactamase superfamily)
MKIKPYIYRGRFYNDSQDSIFSRLVNLVKGIFFIIAFRFKHRRSIKEQRLQLAGVMRDWVVKPSIIQRSDDLIVTWLGHAMFLIQVDGLNIITDPVFDGFSRTVPRFGASVISADQLPPIDVIIISHNHKDHLDHSSIMDLKKYQPRIFAPLGNKKWFARRGFKFIFDLDWWQEIDAGNGVKLCFLPSSHWTSRGLFDINKTLWGSWLIIGQQQKVYFAGDTAKADHFAAIKKHCGPIDVALMPIGPIEPHHFFFDAHMNSQETVTAFKELGALHFVPMHWGTFRFGVDSFLLPLDRIQHEWYTQSLTELGRVLHLVKQGESRRFDKRVIDSIFQPKEQSLEL